MALQEIINTTTTEQRGTTIDGHLILAGPKTPGCYSTGFAVHRDLVPFLAEVKHYTSVSAALITVQQGSRRRDLTLQTMSVHMPSSIEHTVDDADDVLGQVTDVLRGRRTMRLLGADLNLELYDQRPDNFVGQALLPTKTARQTTGRNHHPFEEVVHCSVRAWKMRALSTFGKWSEGLCDTDDASTAAHTARPRQDDGQEPRSRHADDDDEAIHGHDDERDDHAMHYALLPQHTTLPHTTEASRATGRPTDYRLQSARDKHTPHQHPPTTTLTTPLLPRMEQPFAAPTATAPTAPGPTRWVEDASRQGPGAVYPRAQATPATDRFMHPCPITTSSRRTRLPTTSDVTEAGRTQEAGRPGEPVEDDRRLTTMRQDDETLLADQLQGPRRHGRAGASAGRRGRRQTRARNTNNRPTTQRRRRGGWTPPTSAATWPPAPGATRCTIH